MVLIILFIRTSIRDIFIINIFFKYKIDIREVDIHIRVGASQTVPVHEVMFNNADRTHSCDFAITL